MTQQMFYYYMGFVEMLTENFWQGSTPQKKKEES